ncbi:valine--tRNA ligase [Candidatus Saccharibacteria bacterium]|nr:valine--tRNA ligase [Candidatus Saccharibacteria bacterium]
MNLPKTYEPAEYEGDIYALWEKSEAFVPKSRGSKDTFSIVVPPPNANGNLHIGHGLTLAIEDIAVRYHRMKGEASLLLPGADHAGFETQVVYEKELLKQGKSRFDFSREDLYAQIWDFVAQNKDNYESQFRRLGASVDWSRYTYTLDEKIVRQAYSTFKKMWEEKLIYRGERLVNYCTFHRTGFADIEVAYEDATTPLYYMKYGPFELATTRPETKFGDTAVAVHPDDERYQEYVGKIVTVQGVNGPFDVQVIADEMVDPKFGTGVVKITPAHSFDDWEVAQRHNLPAVRVINHDGTLNEKTGRFRGMTVLEGRKAVAEALKDMDLLIKVDENYQNRVGKCYKCDTIIEPMLLDQWFIDMQPLAAPAIKALRDNKITFYPENKKQQLISYYKSLRDWNISRQIAWGIPIPAFQNVDDRDDWIYDERVDQEIIEVNGKIYHRDPDVFDTWFSSSSWPYATLEYPNSVDSKDFYPTTMMETGADILYPWVSRMIMFGLYITDKVPFETVYLHGLIQDEQGQKMSKSKGNVVDPMSVVDEYGSDAFRMGIVTGESAGNNRPFDRTKVVGARNFCNKLWNVARFVEDKIGDEYQQKGSPVAQTIADRWMLYRLHHSTEVITKYLDDYRFSEASDAVYHLLWDDFADWYIEASKTSVNKGVLAYGLETILKLAHPFAPFLTETIWQTLKWENDSLLITSEWPKAGKSDVKLAKEFEVIKAMVTEVRYIKGAMHLRSGINLYHAGEKFLSEHAELIKSLARLETIKEVRDGEGLHLTSAPFRCWLDIDQATAGQFMSELKTKAKEVDKSIKQLEERLSNKGYVSKAPKQLIEESEAQLAEAKTQLNKIRDEYKRFGG